MVASLVNLFAPRTNQTQLAIDKNLTTCPIQGNDDLYGLGIRVGVYIQMCTVQLASLASDHLSVENTLGESAIIFVFADAIVLIKQLVNREIQPIEVFLVIFMIAQLLLVAEISSRNTTVRVIRVVCSQCLLIISAWFWWYGMDILPRACEDDNVFFLGKFSLWRWFRIFFGIRSASGVYNSAVWAFPFLKPIFQCVTSTVTSIFQGSSLHLQNPWRRRQGRGKAAAPDEQNRIGRFGILAGIDVVMVIEITIKWNNISDVHNLAKPGQLMPFLIALAQLFSLFFNVAKALLRLNTQPEQFNEIDDDDLQCMHGVLLGVHTNGIPYQKL